MHMVHDPAVSQARWDIAEQHLPKLCVRTGINAVEPENAIEWVAICEYKRIHGTDVIKKCLVSSYCTPIWVCFPINIKETNRHKKANKVSYLISSNLKSLLFSLKIIHTIPYNRILFHVIPCNESVLYAINKDFWPKDIQNSRQQNIEKVRNLPIKCWHVPELLSGMVV